MRLIMGVLRSKHGVYYVRKKVPPKLEEAVSRVLGVPRPRVSWLKRSLHTKDVREANIRAKPVLMEFDRILASAAGELQATPLRTNLSDQEIERIAAYHFASVLDEDEEVRREGTGSEELFQRTAQDLRETGLDFWTPFATLAKPPTFGLSDRELSKLQEDVAWSLPAARKALARGDIGFVKEETEELLAEFGVNLDRNSADYRRLGMAVLRSEVKALEAIARRNRGDVVETPPPVEATQVTHRGDTLSAAMEGWKKAKQPGPNVISEYAHAVRRFTELHGDLPIVDIRRSHVRQFREALQAIPVRRTGALKAATLPELVEWSNKHPDLPKIAPATVNKLLGGVQAIAVWGYHNGLTPDDLPWSDPFARMRLNEDDPSREPWTIAELRLLFSSSVFTTNARPKGGGGEAAYWLPLLGLFTGARLGELAQLSAGDVRTDDATGITFVTITEDERVIDVLALADSTERVFEAVAERVEHVILVRNADASDVATKPLRPCLGVAATRAWLEEREECRSVAVPLPGILSNVQKPQLHKLRVDWNDPPRRSRFDPCAALVTGHSGGGVGRRYGAKEMMRRFGLPRLAEAVAKAQYRGLDLSHLYTDQERRK